MDLQKQSGLPISLNEKGYLDFHGSLPPVKPEPRTLVAMKDFLADPEARFPRPEVYLMYRGIHLPQDIGNLAQAHLRYDITVFQPGLLGQEFSKTAGHFHPIRPGTQIRYPEVYEMISGQALFLMQKMDAVFENVIAAYLVQAKEGDHVILPPDFGHVTVNATDQPLVTANWGESTFISDYEPIKKHHGAAYYLIANGQSGWQVVPNQNYKNLPPLTKLEPKSLSHFGLIKGQPMYYTGQKFPKMLEFLVRPELYLDLLSISNCYYPVAEG